LIDAVYEACAAAGVTVKGVKVNPMQHPLPARAQYINAYVRDERLIVVDLKVDDKVVVRQVTPGERAQARAAGAVAKRRA
jgi:hypothetical protein